MSFLTGLFVIFEQEFRNSPNQLTKVLRVTYCSHFLPSVTRLYYFEGFMKRFAKSALLIFIAIIMTSCDDKKENRNPQFLSSLNIQIPYELMDNVETIDFFKSVENDINEFSDNIEKMVFDGKDILLQDPNNRNELAKNKLGLMSIQFVSNTTKMDGILKETVKYIENAKVNGFDESQLKSLERIKDTLENRISEIDNKYAKYFK